MDLKVLLRVKGYCMRRYEGRVWLQLSTLHDRPHLYFRLYSVWAN